MVTRQPVRAGTFYPASPEDCAAEADRLVAHVPEAVSDPIGGIAPHAGWNFSGPTAGRLFRALKESGKPFETVLFFGAVHTSASFANALHPGGAWRTPL
ncbi:MAG: AmmeMemoRadiSam system protein B, partial [Planctomycetota bacterium]